MCRTVYVANIFPSTLDVVGFVDVGNRTIVHRDGTRSGDWRQALIKAPGIKRLPIEEGKKFYSKAGRLGQLRQVEKEGFVKDKVGGVMEELHVRGGVKG